MATIDMTREELKEFVEEIVNKKIRGQPKLKPRMYVVQSMRTPEEIQASIERNRWTPPEGSPSSLELLREDRDR